MNEVKINEIVYCNAKFKHNKKVYQLEKIVFRNEGNNIYNRRHILDNLKIKESVILYDIEIIERLGFKNKSIGHHKAIKNNEQRNTTTGAYE